MEIKDYLHFYIGKQVLINDNLHEGVIDTLTHLNNLGDCGGNEYEWEAKNCQLILRKLSDMTEEELRQCIKLKEGGRLRENQPLHRRVRTNDMNDTFTQWYYEDFNGLRKVNETIVANLSDDENGLSLIDTNNYYRCHLKVIPFLIKQGFDLFGLIDAGLAIDNKSL